MRILIVGPGVIGASLALTCAGHGHTTLLLGRRQESLARARPLMERAAAELEDSGLAPRCFSEWNQHLDVATQLSDADRNTRLVVEAINEDLQSKQRLFLELEAHFPADTVFASSTSGLSVDDLSARCRDPTRIAVAHFANPPHLMPVVEIVPGSKSRADVMATLVDFVESLGKMPVQLKHDLPGHIFNRIQFAMLREAIALVEDGVATPGEIDTVVKRGLALRLAEEGPLEKIDLAGLQLVHDVASYLFPDLDDSHEPAVLRKMLANNEGGANCGRGFYSWEAGQAEAAIERRNAEVIRHLQRIRS